MAKLRSTAVRAASRARRIGVPAFACLRRSSTAAWRLAWSSDWSELVRRREHAARAIFARRGEIDVGSGDLDFGQANLERLGRRVPFDVARVELGEVEFVTHVAGQDQGALGRETEAAGLAAGDRNIARGERR